MPEYWMPKTRSINRLALGQLLVALRDGTLYHGTAPAFHELETQGPATQAFIGLYAPMDIFYLSLVDWSRLIAPAIDALAKRIRKAESTPCDRLLELPGAMDAAWDVNNGVGLRVVITDHPALTREMAADFGARVVPYFNTTLDALEHRCCVKAIRFDVPLAVPTDG
jgi:hypothetical protein